MGAKTNKRGVTQKNREISFCEGTEADLYDPGLRQVEPTNF